MAKGAHKVGLESQQILRAVELHSAVAVAAAAAAAGGGGGGGGR